MAAYKHVIITSEEEQSNKMVYSSVKKGTIKVSYLGMWDDGSEDESQEYNAFTQKTLMNIVREHQAEGYFITSYMPASGRHAAYGINLGSTIVMAQKVIE